MTASILPLFTNQQLLVYGLLGLFGVGMLVAIFIFAYSIWTHRKYHKVALPSLGTQEEEEVEEAQISAFSLEAVESGPALEQSFAKRLDDDYAFEKLPPLKQPTYEPEENSLPILDELAVPRPAAVPVPATPPAAESDLEARPVEPAVDLDEYGVPESDEPYERALAYMPDEDDDEPTDLPEFSPSPESAASLYRTYNDSEDFQSPPRALESEDDDEDLDFTPVIVKNLPPLDTELPASDVDKMDHRYIESDTSLHESDPDDAAASTGSHPGKRRKDVPTDSTPL